jgi:4,5-DOPA dioxygenase extradiol
MATDQYKRRTILTALGALGLGAGAAMTLRDAAPLDTALDTLGQLPNTEPMPAMFVGHGTPMGALGPNVWTQQWAQTAQSLPRPQAILSISAHWLTDGGSLVTTAASPRTNHDISGFPRQIYDFQYTAPGNPAVARDVATALDGHIPVMGDTEWGFDHGTWLVLKYMYPQADIPVLQLSIDFSRPPAFHYDLAQKLRGLRSKGILVLGSGNVVHNLRERGGTGITEQPRDWAIEFDQRINTAVMSGDHSPAVNFQSMGTLAQMAHPSYDHFLPLLYILGIANRGGSVRTFCEGFQWPGISMRGYVMA